MSHNVAILYPHRAGAVHGDGAESVDIDGSRINYSLVQGLFHCVKLESGVLYKIITSEIEIKLHLLGYGIF